MATNSDTGDYFMVERARVRRQLDAAADRERRLGAVTAQQRQRRAVLEFRHEMLRNFNEPIVKTVHFIKCDENRDHFLFVHYLSIRSASVHIKPDVIKFHCVVEPRGFYWSRLRAETPELVVVIGQRPTMMGAKPLPLRGNGAVFPAHVSDVWRMQILLGARHHSAHHGANHTKY
jgi:hypothetical protein